MNSRYIRIDENVIIEDENGVVRRDYYHDKMHDELVQENVIETIENQISDLEHEKSKYKETPHKVSLKSLIAKHAGILAAFSLVVPPLVCYPLTGNQIVSTIFGAMRFSSLIGIGLAVCTIPIGVALGFSAYAMNKESRNHYNGLLTTLEYLKKVLEEEKIKLEKLIKSRSFCDENDKQQTFSVEKVNDKDALAHLNNSANFYYNCGYNEDKYYEYYQEDTLRDKLKNEYTDHDIEMVEDYLEEKRSHARVRK